MCGIVGIAGFRDDQLVQRMCSLIEHRGPDDIGTYFSDIHSLGMRRLSIIDLVSGHQPMYACGDKVVIVFNGEIYNFMEIRVELEKKGHQFKTNSDTEVILNLYLEWGLEGISRLNGMFAFAISDQREAPVLYLIRDRFGVKPVYYSLIGGKLLFASETKALLASPLLSRKLNSHAINLYLQFRYVPGEKSMFNDVTKLPAGSVLKFSNGKIEITRYWQPEFPEKKIRISEKEAIDRLQVYMETSVKRRLVSDVPVGSFLSGGVDSSIIVAIMRGTHTGPLHTFCIGFNHATDERKYAAEVAQILGTDHHEIICNDSDFSELDRIVWHMDEPIGDAIILPTFLLSHEARKLVKVVLSGEGADEVFGGYLFHKTLLAISRYKKLVPGLIRGMGRGAFGLVPHQLINMAFEYPADLGQDGKNKLVRFLDDIENLSIPALYRSLMTLFPTEELTLRYTPGFAAELKKSTSYFSDKILDSRNDLDKILNVQYRDWLPDLIMLRFDKMTMANSLEGREPYLDHEMFSFAQSLPDKLKVNGWKEKIILRKLGERYLPGHIINRKKSPFYIPLEEYFQRPTFRGLFESFREENYLGDIFSKSYLDSLNLNNTGLVKSKQLFSLITLNRWMKLFLHNKI